MLGFRSVLDILLDVDNWLREHPLDSNPKARICGRYVSLLRYIANWQTPGGDQYDALVIIAHSQGTVITADLLRFLRAQAGAQGMQAYDPQLARLDTLPISVFTMGCPLRQLYGLRFPRLYRWARHDNRQPMSPWQPRDLPLDQRPMPAGLGVGQWINAYRSGDYVGRHLWRTEPCDYKWTGDRSGSDVAAPVPLNSTDGAQRLEFCIGAGAHTHYWDRTGIIIARELDRLIAQA
ncbi:MAG: hypothetical protein HY047_14520 [Acidobacteria bacterium]|nr:hypothetical protein [Acidobacteriota bacterium]